MPKKKTTKKVAKKTISRTPKLSLSFSINDTEQKATGKNVKEVMGKIKLPDAPVTPAILVFKEKGKDELRVFLNIAHVRRYINNEGAKALLEDNWQHQLNTL